MPFKIVEDKATGKFRLYNLKKKEYAKKTFNSKATAVSAGINYGRYRNEVLILKGNKLIKKETKKQPMHKMPDGSMMKGAKHPTKY